MLIEGNNWYKMTIYSKFTKMIIKRIKFIYTSIQIDMHIFLMWVNLRSLECILGEDCVTF